MDNETLVTTPEENTEQTTPEVEGSEVTEAIGGTPEETGQIDLVKELKSSGQIPKGVEPFRDERGELKFIIPINGKKYIANFKQVLGGFNLNTAGEQKLKAGKELEKKFETILDNIGAHNPNGKKELKKFLVKLGYDLGELSETYMNEIIEERTLDPKELEKRRRLEELEERDLKLQELEKQGELTKEQQLVAQKQQQFTTEIVNAMKSKKLDNTSADLKKLLMQGVLGEMITARHADYDMNAEEALENVLGQFDMLLDNLSNLYSTEHLKRRLPKKFRELVMSLSLEDSAPPTVNSIHGGSVEIDDDKLALIEKKKAALKPVKKKILLSEF